MRPQSIIWFERLFFAGLILGGLNYLLAYDDTMAQLNADPALAEIGLGSGFAIGIYVVGVAINLLLWYFIARRGSNVARILYLILALLGFLGLPALFTSGFSLPIILSLVGFAMQIAMLVLLFRPDAKPWFSGQGPDDPAVFD